MPADKICLYCKHFYIEPGSPGYSEVTPWFDMSMGCRKDVWYLDQDEDTDETYRQKMASAATCDKFEEIQRPNPDSAA